VGQFPLKHTKLKFHDSTNPSPSLLKLDVSTFSMPDAVSSLKGTTDSQNSDGKQHGGIRTPISSKPLELSSTHSAIMSLSFAVSPADFTRRQGGCLHVACGTSDIGLSLSLCEVA
jgi:hypothetical protein